MTQIWVSVTVQATRADSLPSTCGVVCVYFWTLFLLFIHQQFFFPVSICTRRSFSETKELRHFKLSCLGEWKLVLWSLVLQLNLFLGKNEKGAFGERKKKHIPQRSRNGHQMRRRILGQWKRCRCKRRHSKRCSIRFHNDTSMSRPKAAWQVECQAFHTGDHWRVCVWQGTLEEL